MNKFDKLFNTIMEDKSSSKIKAKKVIKEEWSRDWDYDQDQEDEQEEDDYEYDWDIEEDDGFDINEETGEFERNVSKYAPDAEEELGHYYGRLYGTIKGNTIEWKCQCHSDAADQDMEPEINGKTHGIKRVRKGQTVNMVLSNLWAEFMEAFEELDVRDMYG